jgi:transcription elongation factor Elf1
MPVVETFHVNYFVGALLAQGGNLWLEDSKLVFSPTSAIDRAMGAQDVEIPFHTIRGVDYSGPLSRSFNIKTDDKIHKFEGGQAKKVWESLEKVLSQKGLSLPSHQKHQGSLNCPQCEQNLQVGFSFCPHCGIRLKSVCPSCHKAVEASWVACAFCGSKFTPSAQPQP